MSPPLAQPAARLGILQITACRICRPDADDGLARDRRGSLFMFHTTGPTESPVDGQGAIGNLAEPRQALTQFYKALNARDIGMMEQNWVASSDAAMDNPLGGITRAGPISIPSTSGSSQ